MISASDQQRGFSLLEVAVVLLIMTVVLSFAVFASNNVMPNYDADSALNVQRTYFSGNVSGNYRFGEHWVADAGVTYRYGKTENVGDVHFNDITCEEALSSATTVNIFPPILKTRSFPH